MRLRLDTARIGDTPLHAALSASSGALLLATQSADGLTWLRLMHATSLRPVCDISAYLLMLRVGLPAGSLPLDSSGYHQNTSKPSCQDCPSSVDWLTQLVEVQLREGQLADAMHVGSVPLVAGGPPRNHGPPGVASISSGSGSLVELAIVAHHDVGHSDERARLQLGVAGQPLQPSPHAPVLSFFTVQHTPAEDAAQDECVARGNFLLLLSLGVVPLLQIVLGADRAADLHTLAYQSIGLRESDIPAALSLAQVPAAAARHQACAQHLPRGDTAAVGRRRWRQRPAHRRLPPRRDGKAVAKCSLQLGTV